MPAPGPPGGGPKATQSDASLDQLLGFLAAVAGWFVGLGSLSDNSFFTHLATGRVILDTGHIPRSDPYTFSAAGHAWVVQSWLASVLYGVLDRVGGEMSLVLLRAACAAALGWLVWTLARPARSPLVRVALLVVALAVGNTYWAERPLLIGLVLLGVALLAAEDRLDARWLVPGFWVWVNVHGSFPLGLVALAALAIGTRLDGRSPVAELRALKMAVLGTVLGGLNPLGPRLLVFPLELLSKVGTLKEIREWQAPAFQSLSDRMFVLLLVAAIVALVRRPSWRFAVVLGLFLPAALLGARNVVVASLVLVPGVADGLAGLGSLDGALRRRTFRPAAAVLVAAALVATIGFAKGRPAIDDSSYPRAAVAYASSIGVLGAGHRVVAQDVVGNYLELLEGPTGSVFFDDRLDMLPKAVVQQYLSLLHGAPDWAEVLGALHPDVVIWERAQPLAQLLEASPAWRIAYQDRTWVLALPV